MTQIIGLGGQKNVNFTLWDINQQYRPGDMVVYNSVIYTTTANIPAGTPWGPEWTIAVSGGTATYAAEADVAFNLDAADPANLTIAGGNVGDVLTTDGAGNVSWAAPGGAASLPIANGTSQFDIPVADGTVEITSNGTHTWTFGDTGTLSVPGAIIPDANIAYDLGNATNRFRDLYLSNNTIYMGDESISANAGVITFSGNIGATGMAASGNVTIAGNLTVTGNTTHINVTDLMVQDPIISMGGGANGANVTTYDGKDRGILLQDYYPDDSGVNNHFFGWVSASGQFEAIANVTDASTGVIAGTAGNIAALNFNVLLDGAVTFPKNTTIISENVLGAEVNTVALPTQTVTGSGTGATLRVRYTPGSASYTRAFGQGDGTGYALGDQVMVPGSELGGTDGVNDLLVEVDAVDGSGAIDFGNQIVVSGTPIAGPAGVNIETDGDNWSFADRTFTVPGDIQNDGRNDFDIICNDPEDDDLLLTLKLNVEGTVTSMVELENGRVNLEVEDQVDIRVLNNSSSGYHRWSFGSSGTKGVLSLIDDTSEIETNDNDLNLVACKSSTFANGNDVSLISRWNTNNVEWTKATVGYENITFTTNMGRSATEYQWTFTQGGSLQLPEYNNEQSALIGTRNTIATTASAITAPIGTQTVIYTPTTDVYSYKIIVTIKHDNGGSFEIETFEVMASNGATSMVFTVSNRLNTLGSNGGLNDATVTIGNGFELSIEPKYGTTNTVTFAVTEFK